MSFGYQYRPDHGRPVEMGHLVEARVNSPLTRQVDDYLDRGGVLEQQLNGFVARAPQLAVAHVVARALELGRPAAVQGGTGVGKSLGYLVPALLWGPPKQKRVIVSTASRPLQEQLVGDLRRLQALTPWFNFRPANLKGFSNYACQAKLHGADEPEFEDELEQLSAWDRLTATGDLAELPWDLEQEELAPLRRAVTTTRDHCTGRKRCPFGDSCWFFRAKDRAGEADIVVVNHALLAMHLALGGLLPEFAAAIIDEAHQLEQYVRSAQTALLGWPRFKAFRRRLEGHLGTQTMEKLPFGPVANQVEQLLPGRVQTFSPSLREAAGSLAEQLEFATDGGALEWIEAMVAELAADLRKVADPSEDLVAWVKRDQLATLHLAPLDVAPFLADRLFRQRPVILTSATLAGPGQGREKWDAPQRDLGFTTSLLYAVDSPWDWRKSLLYYLAPSIPRDLHERKRYGSGSGTPKYNGAQKAALYAPEIRAMLEATDGRAFLLFTSWEVLEATWSLMAGWPWPLMRQGQLSKTETMRWFNEVENPVLLATRGYWEGIDPRQLRLVVIDQIPYPNPQDPIEQVRSQRLTRSEYLHQVQIPHASIHLRQAVGRVVRQVGHRGLVGLLDPRFRYTDAGARILGSLQGHPTARTTLTTAALSGVRAWLKGGHGA